MDNNIIILLEDDHYIAQVYRLILESKGYRVIYGENSNGIVELVRHYSPALVITDLVMPDHDGLEGIFEVLENCSVPVIAISAYEEYLKLAKPVVAATLLKPLTAEELLETVSSILVKTITKPSIAK